MKSGTLSTFSSQVDLGMDLSTRLLLWQQLAESCGLATLQQGLQQVWKLLLLCLLCRLCFRLGESPSGGVSTAKHAASLLAGVSALYLFFQGSLVWLLLLAGLCYPLLLLSSPSSSRGLLLSALVLLFLLVG